jgi:hypothetical protein
VTDLDLVTVEVHLVRFGVGCLTFRGLIITRGVSGRTFAYVLPYGRLLIATWRNAPFPGLIVLCIDALARGLGLAFQPRRDVWIPPLRPASVSSPSLVHQPVCFRCIINAPVSAAASPRPPA